MEGSGSSGRVVGIVHTYILVPLRFRGAVKPKTLRDVFLFVYGRGLPCRRGSFQGSM